MNRVAKRARVVILSVLVSLPAAAPARGQQSVRVWQDSLVLPTYEEGLPDPDPPFDAFVTNGRWNYPYTLRNALTDRRSPHAWRALMLENEYLRCAVLPDLGGHLYSCTDKRNGAELFYANPSIKLTQIAYRGAWAAFGIEFNFPVSHNWMTTSPVDFAITHNDDGSASIHVGNIDRPYGTQWMVTLTLRPDRAVLEQHTTLYNRSDVRNRFYWWTNAAVRVWDDSRILYPMRYTASHGFRDIDTWPVDGTGNDLSVVGNHRYGPVSRFSHGSREPFMAVWHPHTKAGVVHWSSPVDLPAKKIWSWGSNPDGLDWRRALSDDSSAYVEIQAGIFRNQETYGFLEPGETIRFSEYWMPVRDLGGVSRANPDAILSLAPDSAADSTTVALEVTRRLPGAVLFVRRYARLLELRRLDLGPDSVFRLRVDGAACCTTVELRDSAEAIVLAHTDGEYDVTPDSLIRTGPVPAPAPLPEPDRNDGDWAATGEERERQGDRLGALETYRAGLARFPASAALSKDAGRLLVILKRFDEAVAPLGAVLDRVSNDREASYYLGLALLQTGDTARARLELEKAQSYGTYRAAARHSLAALAARHGDLGRALTLLDTALAESPFDTRAANLRVALLRADGQTRAALARLDALRRLDPAGSMPRYEGTRLGQADPALWAHLAGDPERILEIAVEYVRAGLWADALDLLAREYPEGDGVVREPGTPAPGRYPLIAYYRGFVRESFGQDGDADFDAASRMPATYVFPNRPETFAVLEAALRHDPGDALAHALLGSLHMSGDAVDAAVTEWREALRLDPTMPVLHRNIGYALLRERGDAAAAISTFDQGMRVDPGNVDLYFGMDEALRALDRPAAERADALLRFPDRAAMPSTLVYLLARTLAEADRFDGADALFVNRFFPRREGGTNPRQVWLEVRLARATWLAGQRRCGEARTVVDGLGRPVRGVSFIDDGLRALLETAQFRAAVAAVRTSCPARS